MNSNHFEGVGDYIDIPPGEPQYPWEMVEGTNLPLYEVLSDTTVSVSAYLELRVVHYNLYRNNIYPGFYGVISIVSKRNQETDKIEQIKNLLFICMYGELRGISKGLAQYLEMQR